MKKWLDKTLLTQFYIALPVHETNVKYLLSILIVFLRTPCLILIRLRYTLQ